MPHDMPVTNFERRPLFVTVFAAALSSLCFGLSIVAIGAVWLNIWQQSPLPTIPSRRKPSSRRQSAPAALESAHRGIQAKPPSIIAPSRNSLSESTPRRVYFVDSGVSPQPRNLIPQSPRLSEISPQASPYSSSSTLVSSTPPHAPLLPLDTCEESAVDSDNSSSRKSYRPAFKLPKLMTRTHRRVLSTAEGYASQSEDPPVFTPIKRSSTGTSFQKSWQMPRIGRTSVDSVQDGPPRPSSSRMSFRIPGSRVTSTPVLSPTEDSQTAKTRSTLNKAPIPRTHPYEYPYFAAPPIASRQNQHEDSDPERTPMPEDLEAQRERKQTNAQAQAALGWGRPVQKRRATSEGYVKN